MTATFYVGDAIEVMGKCEWADCTEDAIGHAAGSGFHGFVCSRHSYRHIRENWREPIEAMGKP